MTAIGTPNPQVVQQFLLAVLDYVIARDAAIERERAQKAAELAQPTSDSAVESFPAGLHLHGLALVLQRGMID